MTQPRPGVLVWSAPHGRSYTVTPDAAGQWQGVSSKSRLGRLRESFPASVPWLASAMLAEVLTDWASMIAAIAAGSDAR